MGAALMRTGALVEAAEHLWTVVRLSPENTRAQAFLGSALFQLGKFREAIPHLKTGVGADEDGSVHYQLGQAYVRTGQQELAVAALREFSERSKSSPAHHKPMEQEITPP